MSASVFSTRIHPVSGAVSPSVPGSSSVPPGSPRPLPDTVSADSAAGISSAARAAMGVAMRIKRHREIKNAVIRFDIVVCFLLSFFQPHRPDDQPVRCDPDWGAGIQG